MGTAAPLIVPALLTVWQPLRGTYGLALIHGPSITGEKPPALFAGYDGDPDSDFEAITTDRGPVSMDSQFTERVTVRNGLWVWNGDGDAAALEVAAYALFNAVTDLVDADPTLGLTNVDAHIPGSRYTPRPSGDSGLEGLLQFDVIAEVL